MAVPAPRGQEWADSVTAGPRFTAAGLLSLLTFFAIWTTCYHVALVIGMQAAPTLLVAGVLWSVGTILLRPARVLDDTGAIGPATNDARGGQADAAPALCTVGGAGLVTAVMLALAWVGRPGVGVAVGCAAAVAHLHARRRARVRADGASVETLPLRALAARPNRSAATLWATGWLLGVGSGVLSMFYARPDGDDAFFLNRSVWVATHGTFPTRDTMISDQVFPDPTLHTPPVESFEPLIGVLARLTGLQVGTLTYIVANPLLTVVAVLTLTWLVHQMRLRAAPLALTAATVGLWTSGGDVDFGAFGNMFALRLWQGKTVMCIVVLPAAFLLVTALIRRPTARGHILLGAALVACIGLSNSAVFLLPVLLVASAVAAAVEHGLRTAAQVAVWVAYPAAVGALIVLYASPPRPAGAPTRQDLGIPPSSPLDPLMTVPGSAGLLVVFVAAVGLGWLGLRQRESRTAALALVAAAAGFLSPVVQSIATPMLQIGAVAWRMWWIAPVPLLTAGLVSAAASMVTGPTSRPAANVARGRLRAAAALGTGAAVAFVPLVGGWWLGDPRNRETRQVSPLSWKVPPGSLREASWVVEHSASGDVVLVPWDTARVLAGLTVEVRPVAARSFYLPGYLGTPDAQVEARNVLQSFVDRRTPERQVVADALERVPVDMVCIGTHRRHGIALLNQLGYREEGLVGNLTCLRAAH